MTRVALVMLALAGCAHTRAPAKTSTENQPNPALVEKGAALFDAATHDDRLRLKTLVDWPRWRTVAAWQSAHDAASADRAIATLEADAQPGDAFVDGETQKLAARLTSVAAGTMPPQPMMSPSDELQRLRHGAQGTMSPSEARLATYAREAVEGADDITYRGSGRVTLAFVAGQLVGVFE
jgi:hypothetical protein